MQINTSWKMTYNGRGYNSGALPISCLKTLQNAGELQDLNVGENQYLAAQLCEKGCTFTTQFDAPEFNEPWLVFHGLDTLAEVSLNGVHIGSADNMHRTWRFPVERSLLKAQGNLLEVSLASPMEHVKKAYEKRPIYGVDSTVEGFPHIRKAHYMFGWDWGAVIPDMGIFRSVELCESSLRLRTDIKQSFFEERSRAVLEVAPVLLYEDASADEERCSDEQFTAEVTFCGETQRISSGERAVFEIESPKLWYPRGYGEAVLHPLETKLCTQSGAVLEKRERIGLREIRLCREQDEGGRSFCFEVNGVKIFARGANYIPQDNLLPNINDERTEKLLADMCEQNCNMVRVWGGGYYPEDSFFELCDSLGLLVWEDFMFACAAYDFDERQLHGIFREACDNISRIKNHPSLALWCGNNEIESMWEYWGVPHDPAAQQCYRKLFEYGVIPDAISCCRSDTAYWPSSPSTGGGVYEGSECFKNSSTTHLGDSHYWEVWHSFKPIEEFRKYTHRFCSEFGFEALPDHKTVRYFAQQDDPNICSPVMQAHQKCTLGNEKLMFYMAQMAQIPPTMRGMVYASQLVQAECIRYDVEHLRRSRGISMGALYWQINDCAPMISWSAIDYFGCKKALHWYARRFYADVLLSCDESDVAAVRFNISSELLHTLSAELSWRLRENTGEVLLEGTIAAEVRPLSQQDHFKVDLSQYFLTREQKRSRYIEYTLTSGGEELSEGTQLFVRPKEFAFLPCGVSVTNIEERSDRFVLTFETEQFVHALCIDHAEYVLSLSDNWFGLHRGLTKTVEVSKTAQRLDGAQVTLSQEDIHSLTMLHCGNYLEA